MKKIIKNIIYYTFILFSIVYFYIHRDHFINIFHSVGLYAETMLQPEIIYDETYKINDILFQSDNYYYHLLDDNKKAIYLAIAQGVKNLDTEIMLKDYLFESSEKTLNDVDVVLNYFHMDHPEVFYMDNQYEISTLSSVLGDNVTLKLNYFVKDKKELDSKIVAINQKINEYINLIDKEEVINAEISLHDMLAQNVSYYYFENTNEIPTTCHTIEGAFLENLAVCDGLAKAYQILLNNIDLESIIVSGKLEGVPHAWNMVKLENEWYHVDITSAKAIKEQDIVIHSYFNITTEYIKKTHEIDEETVIPKAQANQYQYYQYMGYYVAKNEDLDSKISKIVQESRDQNVIEIYVENDYNVLDDIYNVVHEHYRNVFNNSNQIRYYKILNVYILMKVG